MELEEGAAFLPTMLKRRRAARKRPRAVMMVPEKGMESLTNALALQLRESLGSRFHSGQAVETLPDSPNIILCTPANAAAELIGDADTALSAGLRDLSYTPLISCTVFARKNDFKSCPKGVGVLVPAQEQRDCLGILFPSSSFEGRTTSSEMMSFTVMLGGTARPDIIQKSDGDVRNMVAREMKDILGLRGPIQNISVFRHTRAIPLYSPAILDLWQTARSGWCSQPGHLLFGNYTGQVSIRGMMETMHALTHTSDN
jgi:oxygen-dependent protoporphyrinogen oxidase